MFRKLIDKTRIHEEKDKICIGYHGNKVHLEHFESEINISLDNLSKKYDIELLAMYNIKELGKWSKNLPKRVSIRHIQWSEENYYKELEKCDIGIVPNLVSVNRYLANKITSLKAVINKVDGYEWSDYITRYKYSSNPGRIHVFAKLGIPVVSDFSPSACQFIEDGVSGILADGRLGWYRAIEKLIKNYELRQKMAVNLKRKFTGQYTPEKIYSNFVKYLYEFDK